MSAVPDGSLSSFLSRWGKLKEELVRKYTRQLLLGLEYLHSQNIMHRDLKVRAGRCMSEGA